MTALLVVVGLGLLAWAFTAGVGRAWQVGYEQLSRPERLVVGGLSAAGGVWLVMWYAINLPGRWSANVFGTRAEELAPASWSWLLPGLVLLGVPIGMVLYAYIRLRRD